jgi:uncharacterized membrane protein YgdD (TMEM256/DUF423 family)
MNAPFLTIGALSGALAVFLGAFGAHALRARLPAEQLAVYETGVRYQFYHALALVAVGVVQAIRPEAGLLAAAGWLFTIGTLIFSGSLYLLVLAGRRWLGAITPLGGLAFIAGWICLALAV